MKMTWMEVVHDLLFVYSWALAVGIVVGMGHGWPAGLAVGVGVAGLLYGVARAARAIVRKARQTKVPQRAWPHAGPDTRP